MCNNDVVQLYIKAEDSPLVPQNPVLCGFKRVHAEPGQCLSAQLRVEARALLVVDDDGNRIDGGSRYTLYAGYAAGRAQPGTDGLRASVHRNRAVAIC